MHNLLVGFDGSRGAQMALRQIIPLAAGLRARLRVVQVVEPIGPSSKINLEVGDDPLSILDRSEALMTEETPLPPDDDALAAAAQTCEQAGVIATYQTLHGMAARVLREEAVAMDLLVVGRHGTTGRHALGTTAATLTRQALVPTLLCRDEMVPWQRLLVAFEPSPVGGRALKLAGALAAGLNLGLDVLVADPQRSRAQEALSYARRALRAYHVEGEGMQHTGRMPGALETIAAQWQSSVVIVPDEPCRTWLWRPSPTVAAALRLPHALILIVP